MDLDFENSAEWYDTGLLPEPKKIKFTSILGCENCNFVGNFDKILWVFLFIALELVMDGVCRQVFIHIMKLHYIVVLFDIITYRRHPASRGQNRRLKKKYQ